MNVTILCNIITEVIFGEKQITDPVHTKGEGITQGYKYQEAEITGATLGSFCCFNQESCAEYLIWCISRDEVGIRQTE